MPVKYKQPPPEKPKEEEEAPVVPAAVKPVVHVETPKPPVKAPETPPEPITQKGEQEPKKKKVKFPWELP